MTNPLLTNDPPMGFGPGGPLPAPSPWTTYGTYVSFGGGVVVGAPTGGNRGNGTINCASIYVNGVALSSVNYLPTAGGNITGNLSIGGTLTVTGNTVLHGITGLNLDMNTSNLSILRYNTFGTRPATGTQPYGSPYVNIAGNQFGVVDSTLVARDLIGVPYFSILANYTTGQPVNYNGNLYVALTSVSAGAWNASQWSPVASLAAMASVGTSGGNVNKFRNGSMEIAQRGAGPFLISPTTPAYTLDGWIVTSAGGNVTVNQVAGRGASGSSANSLRVTGGPGVTTAQVAQYIESIIAAPLNAGQVTFQAQILNTGGAAFAPSLSVLALNSKDNPSGGFTTILNSATLQVCNPGVWTRVSYTFSTTSVSTLNGIDVDLVFPAIAVNSTSEIVTISEMDIRVTPGVTIGINNTPPVPELRPSPIELSMCQRYYQIIGGWVVAGYSALGGAYNSTTLVFPCQMRVSPTVSLNITGESNVSSLGIGGTSAILIQTYVNTIGEGAYSVVVNVALSAEM